MSGDVPRIVVVDDDPDAFARLEQLLADEYDVVWASSWAELNTLVFRDGCDLVLMDVNLPVLKGDQLVEILCRFCTPDYQERPRIVFYSSADEGTLNRLVRETGADGYLCKSLRSVDLLERIERHLT